jgi:hypothetical protein
VFAQRLAQKCLERSYETLLVLTGFPLIHALFQNQLILDIGELARIRFLSTFARQRFVLSLHAHFRPPDAGPSCK